MSRLQDPGVGRRGLHPSCAMPRTGEWRYLRKKDEGLGCRRECSSSSWSGSRSSRTSRRYFTCGGATWGSSSPFRQPFSCARGGGTRRSSIAGASQWTRRWPGTVQGCRPAWATSSWRPACWSSPCRRVPSSNRSSRTTFGMCGAPSPGARAGLVLSSPVVGWFATVDSHSRLVRTGHAGECRTQFGGTAADARLQP